LAAFRLEPAAVQSIPTETDTWISRIYREFLGGWYTGGGGPEILILICPASPRNFEAGRNKEANHEN
jgi:hypothetical protein